MGLYHMYVCLCTTSLWVYMKNGKGLARFELQVCVDHPVWVLETKLGPLAEQQVNAKLTLLNTKHILMKSLYFNCECPVTIRQHKHNYSYF